MSGIFSDPRVQEGGNLALDAERLERDGRIADARACYVDAAARYHAAAISVAAAPKARAVIAVSAVCYAARGGRFDRAVEYAERFLAEPGSYGDEGARSLESLLADFRRAMAPTPAATEHGGGLRPPRWREGIREKYRREAA